MKRLLLPILLCASNFLPVAETSGQTRRPNILYILADDLGFSDLGCFGGEIHTPTLDALAAGGARLTQFYNTGRCCPSRAALLTGQYPHRVGLGHMTTNDLGHPGYRGVVSDEARTIAQVLAPAGYRCFMSGKWHLGTPDPTRHGFEEMYGTLVSAKRFFDPDHLVRFPEGRKARSYPPGKFYATDAVTDHALDFLQLARETPDKPWFLYLAYNAPHFPLHAPKEEIAKYAKRYHGGWDKLREERLARMKTLGIVPDHTQLSPRSHWRNYGETKTGVNPAWNTLPEDRRLDLARRMAIYAAMIDRLDQQITRVVADLKRADEFENTLIVFTSDNGACFEWDPFGFDIVSSNQNILHRGEMLDQMGSPGTFHSLGSGWANAANTPWRLYKHFNHEGGIASPGIVHWPAGLKVTPGSILHQPAHLIDLLPSAIAAAQTRYEGKLPLPGVDLVNQLHGKGDERTLFFEHQGNRAVRRGDWKLVALDDEPWELYDFTRDRTEMNDLSGKYPALVKEFADAWEKWAEANHVTPLPRDLGVAYLKPD
jgi:arylsulfatase A-like enzyme